MTRFTALFALAALVPILSLADCASQTEDAAACLVVKPWSDVEQQNMKADLEALPTNSMLGQAMIDYYRMREQSRACDDVTKWVM